MTVPPTIFLPSLSRFELADILYQLADGMLELPECVDLHSHVFKVRDACGNVIAFAEVNQPEDTE
jgi:hypothetical protein